MRVLALVLAVLSLALPATAEDASWSEPGFGVTLAAPEAAEPITPPPPGTLAAWSLADGSLLRVRIVESDAPIGDLRQTQAGGWADFTVGVRRSSWLEERRVGERPGLVQVLELETSPSRFIPPAYRAGDTTFGQAMMKLDPYHLVLVELFVDGRAAEATRPRIHGLADAVSVVEPPVTMRRRRASVERAADFLAGLDRDAALAALPRRLDFAVGPAEGDGEGVRGEATRRVLTDPAEVAQLDVAIGPRGLAAGWSVVVDGEDGRLALFDEAYADPAGDAEAWSRRRFSGVVQAASAHGLPSAAPPTVAARRTGTRTGSTIEMVVSNPPAEGGDGLNAEEFKTWQIPERLPNALLDDTPVTASPRDAYLNRLDVLLLPELLPRDAAAEYVFYALDAESLRLALRLYRVEPRPGGGADVYERATPAAAPALHRLDAAGRLVEVVQPSGLTFRVREDGA